MGSPAHFFVFSLVALVISSQMFYLNEAVTYWGDTQALKELKDAVEPNSVSPGSCMSSWDFSLDPCDNLFSDKFTCGFRCDTVVSGQSRLTELTLDQAGYSGSLNSVSFNLPYLQALDLSGNYFTDVIPESLSNLTQLSRLSLSRNSFSGPIPTSIGSLSSLQELSMDNNDLQGTIPENFNNLVNLNRLEIQSNNLSGSLPELGSLKNLYYLDASDNSISGEIPSILPISLVQFSMRNNKFSGTIPQSILLLNSLQVLDFSHNNLSGIVPSILFTHTSLQQLTLSYNNFSSIQTPSYNYIESQLIAVDISNNMIKGFLPMFLGLMPKLSALSLENNLFTGMIPTQYAIKAVVPIDGVSQFGRLFLGGNYLFGPIPGLFWGLKPDSDANVSLVNNCLYRCPRRFFVCQGGDQKSSLECKSNGPFIP